MRIGRHCSTAGSLERAAKTAVAAGANSVQIFSASPRMWRAKRPDPVQVRLLQAERDTHDIFPLVVHDSYLINLASPPSIVREKSIRAFTGEIERALLIGAEYLVTHPGNYKGLTAEQGMLNVSEAMVLAWRNVDPSLIKQCKLTILLENTAGAGAQLGGKLDELATIRTLVTPYLDIEVGFCLDTCHSYVFGFNLATEEGVLEFIATAEETLGLENVPVFHSNDAKAPLGSHLDRHANIGAGYIGLEGFRRLLNHPSISTNIPCEKAFICETPVNKPGDDKRDVTALKELVSPKKRSTSKKSSPDGTKGGRRTLLST